jgi:membrane dipeptidase
MVGEMGFREEHRIDPLATLDGFSDYLDFPNIARGLVSRGYSDDEISGILGGNFLRVFEEVCG